VSEATSPVEPSVDVAAFAAKWLAQQCSVIPGVSHGVVVLGTPPAERYTPVALWPQGAPPSPALIAAAELALAEGRGVLSRPAGQPARLVVPLMIDSTARGVVGLELASGATAPRSAMRQLEWGVAALREHLSTERTREALVRATRADTTLESVATTLEQERFLAAAQAAVSELALRLGCERVSIGFVEKDRCRVTAISQSAGFGRKVELTQALEAAMDEAIEQQTSLIYPPLAGCDTAVLRAHERLARRSAGAALTVPFAVRARFSGALLAERVPGQPFDQATVDELGAAAALLGPILEGKRQNDRPIAFKLLEAFKQQQLRMFGPQYMGRKLAAIIFLFLLLLALVVKAPYRVTADARIEGRVQRSVVAPYDGFIRSATARAGDVVAKDQELARLDDRDLTLERLNRVTERQQRQLAYDRALGERDRVQSSIALAQIEESSAQIGLLDNLLERSRLAAPFKGVVVSGDLSRSIGATVRRGEVLFQIAPLDEYRVVLSVDESQIADLRKDQTGRLLTTSLPSHPFALKVEQITPVAEVRDGRTVFRVEALLQGSPAALRPGMEGVAKIEVESRRVVWIWTRTFVDWLRIKLWAWW
jgi:multidrug resistance efflux pump